MKLADALPRWCMSLGGGTLAGIGIADHRVFAMAVGGALVGGAIEAPLQSLFKPKKTPQRNLEQRTVQLERETGLVFDIVGEPRIADPERDVVCRLWPGYWEWMKADSPEFMAVRPEGCKDNYWLNPDEHLALDAVEYFEQEVPRLLEQLALEEKSNQARLRQQQREKDEKRDLERKASMERLRKRRAEDNAALADAGFAPDYFDGQVDHDCQHVLMENPGGAPGSLFCFLCGSTFSGAATPLPAAAAQSAASGNRKAVGGRVPQAAEQPHPEMKHCPETFNGRHRWRHGVCDLCGVPQR